AMPMTNWYSGFQPRRGLAFTSARRPFTWPPEIAHFLRIAETGMAEPFKGLTTDGTLLQGLYPLQPTGVSTERLRDAAASVLDALTPAQRTTACFPIDSEQWRAW